MTKVNIKAYAKINLALDVLGKREDGYHEVSMIMQGIQLHDSITIEKNISQEIILTCNNKELENGPANLAYQAASLILHNYSISGVHIHIHKRIPVAAGLAGGSTDAAAVLLGINELFQLKLSLDSLREYAAMLGSDIPFCIEPQTAIAMGRGEKVERLQYCPKLCMVLFKPPFGVSTKDAYAHLHNIEIVKRPNIKRMIRALEENNLSEIYDNMINVLEFATFDLHPDLYKWSNEIRELGAQKVMMSGSGPTLIAFVNNIDEAEELASLWRAKYKWDVITSSTIGNDEIDRRMVVYGGSAYITSENR